MAQLLAGKGKGPMVAPTRGRNVGQISVMPTTRDSYPVVRTETVKVAGLDINRRIKEFSWTMIGRAWNPRRQNMEDLIRLLPKILKMEGKVNGADLGMGRFQLNFQSDAEIQEVLSNEPFHFDSWMLSLVRWEPIVASTYPSTLTFWVQVVGIPFHYWAEDTIRKVGNAVGCVKEIDEDSASVKVVVDGFKPIIFRTIIPFDNGDEIEVSLIYEKLTGVCNKCFHISHDIEHCPELRKKGEEKRSDDWEGGARLGTQSGKGGGNKFQKNPMKRGNDGEYVNNQSRYNGRWENKNNGAPPHKRTDNHFQGHWDNKRGKMETPIVDSNQVSKAEPSRGTTNDSNTAKNMVVPGETSSGRSWPKPLYQRNDEEIKGGNTVPGSSLLLLENEDFLLEDGEMDNTPLSVEMEDKLAKYTDDLMHEVANLEAVEPPVSSKSTSANVISKKVINDTNNMQNGKNRGKKLVKKAAPACALTHEGKVKRAENINILSSNKTSLTPGYLGEIGEITVGLKKVGIKDKKVISKKATLLKGVNSKKRNLMTFTSPRKCMESKKLIGKCADATQGKAREETKNQGDANKTGMVALPEPPIDP